MGLIDIPKRPKLWKPPYAEVDRDDPLALGLVGFWPMNEDGDTKVFDLSGNENTGTFEGTAPSWTSGKFGSAVLLPGTDEGINCGQKMTVNGTTGLTIGGWFYFRSLSDNEVVLGQTTLGGTAEEYTIYVLQSKLRFYVRAGDSGVGLVITPAIPLNTWIHIVATLDGTTMVGYYNGEYFGTDTAAGVMTTPTIDFYIGTDSSETYTSDIIVDNGLLCNRPLSASEIDKLYREPFRFLTIPKERALFATTAVACGWFGVGSTNLMAGGAGVGFCGEEVEGTIADALDGAASWIHDANETHWFIIDLGIRYNVKKVRGRSNSDEADPIDINIYVSDDIEDWGAAVGSGIDTWQDTVEWVEVDTTDKDGRYVKVEIVDTEHLSKAIDFGGDPTFAIFDVYVCPAEVPVGANPKNPLGHPLYGALAGPISF